MMQGIIWFNNIYCERYTSIGSVKTTKPNPSLLVENGYKPADKLEDDKLESVYMLQNFDRADLIPANWNVLEEYVKSEIKNIRYDYYTNNSEVDSMEIDSTFEDRIKTRTYTVHFIRFKKKDDTEWTKGVAAFRSDNLSKTTLIPTQFFSSELSDDDSKGGFDIFGMKPKSTPKKELSETEKLENLWLDLKAENRRGYANYGYDYYDDY